MGDDARASNHGGKTTMSSLSSMNSFIVMGIAIVLMIASQMLIRGYYKSGPAFKVPPHRVALTSFLCGAAAFYMMWSVNFT
jgi:hypothetical protein